MRRIWAGLIILAAAAPVLLRAQDKPQKNDAPKTEAKSGPKTPADELGEVTSQFNKDFAEAVTGFRNAKDDDAREAAKAKAFRLPETYAKKMIAFAEKHRDDPAAIDALMWVCVVPASRGLPIHGDAKYGSPHALGNGIALHARSLTFLHPITQEPVTLTAELPPAWRGRFAYLLQPEAAR